MSLKKYAVIDVDDTLMYDWDMTSIPFPNVEMVLKVLKSSGIRMAIASHNPNAQYVLKRAGFDKYFDVIYNYHDSSCKSSHLALICKDFDCAPNDITIYDDDYEVIDESVKNGYHGVLIQDKIGLQMEDILAQLERKRISIFDLDDVLIHEGFDPPVLVDGVADLLQAQLDRGHTLCIATHNTDAANVVAAAGLSKYFSQIVAYDDNTYKQSHVKKIMATHNVEPIDVIFYDDVWENVKDVSALGVHSVVVDWRCGLQQGDII